MSEESYDTLKISFAHEARTAAVNEACVEGDESATCNIVHLCPYCQALANAIEARLIRAFITGQKSMQAAGD